MVAFYGASLVAWRFLKIISAGARSYHHVQSAVYLSNNGLKLHSRPWYRKYRVNVGDHFVGRYNTALDRLLPDDLVAGSSILKHAKRTAEWVTAGSPPHKGLITAP